MIIVEVSGYLWTKQYCNLGELQNWLLIQFGIWGHAEGSACCLVHDTPLAYAFPTV